MVLRDADWKTRCLTEETFFRFLEHVSVLQGILGLLTHFSYVRNPLYKGGFPANSHFLKRTFSEHSQRKTSAFLFYWGLRVAISMCITKWISLNPECCIWEVSPVRGAAATPVWCFLLRILKWGSAERNVPGASFSLGIWSFWVHEVHENELGKAQ